MKYVNVCINTKYVDVRINKKIIYDLEKYVHTIWKYSIGYVST
jgi:hypothetical protein